MLLRGVTDQGEIVVHSGGSFTVCKWEEVLEWVKVRSKRMALKVELGNAEGYMFLLSVISTLYMVGASSRRINQQP